MFRIMQILFIAKVCEYGMKCILQSPVVFVRTMQFSENEFFQSLYFYFAHSPIVE